MTVADCWLSEGGEVYGGKTVIRIATASAALGLVLSVASSAEAAVRLAYPAGDAVVRGHSVASLTESCPATEPHAIGGEFGALAGSDAGRIALASSAPAGRTAWRVTVLNLSSRDVRFGAAAVCLSAPQARFAYPRASTVVPPQGGHGLQIRCPSSAPIPIGATFSMQPGAPPGSAVVNWMTQQGNHHGQPMVETAGMRNLTSVPVGVNIGAVCSTLHVITLAQFNRGTVAPGRSDEWRFTCPAGSFAVGGVFYDLNPSDASQITVAGSFGPGARKWSLIVRSLATHTLRFGSGAVCLRLRR